MNENQNIVNDSTDGIQPATLEIQDNMPEDLKNAIKFYNQTHNFDFDDDSDMTESLETDDEEGFEQEDSIQDDINDISDSSDNMPMGDLF
jgi:hypothetical protein